MVMSGVERIFKKKLLFIVNFKNVGDGNCND